jgi:hypothetical protein
MAYMSSTESRVFSRCGPRLQLEPSKPLHTRACPSKEPILRILSMTASPCLAALSGQPPKPEEAVLPDYSYFAQPMQGSNAIENRIDWSFARLLTPTLAIIIDCGWIHQDWPIGHTSGFDTTDVGLKYEAYRNNEHETLVSVGLLWGIGHSGAQAVGTDGPNTIQPAVYFGKGFGDLPDSLSWLRPFAITGAIVDEAPVGSAG